RAAVDRLALLAAVAALRQSAPEVADLFARTRLEEGHGAIYGTSEISPDNARRLIDRALPAARRKRDQPSLRRCISFIAVSQLPAFRMDICMTRILGPGRRTTEGELRRL